MTHLSPLAATTLAVIKTRAKLGKPMNSPALIYAVNPHGGFEGPTVQGITAALTELVKANLIRFGSSGYYLTELGKGREA